MTELARWAPDLRAVRLHTGSTAQKKMFRRDVRPHACSTLPCLCALCQDLSKVAQGLSQELRSWLHEYIHECIFIPACGPANISCMVCVLLGTCLLIRASAVRDLDRNGLKPSLAGHSMAYVSAVVHNGVMHNRISQKCAQLETQCVCRCWQIPPSWTWW